MFPSFCGAMGPLGWLVMVLVWGGLIALAVWGIARLFPDRPSPAEPPRQRQRQREDASPPLIDSGRR